MIADRLELGFLADHLQLNQQDVLECWTVLSYFAAAQPTLRLGTAVLGQSYRNPALTAKMAATLQFLSGGRLLFGIGAGWKEDEYHAYGYDFPPSGVRVEQLDETLQIIKALWIDEQATFTARYYRVEQARLRAQARSAATHGDRRIEAAMLRLIARHADWWNVSWTGIDDYRAQAAELARACAEVGRDPATLRRPGSAAAPAPRRRRPRGHWRTTLHQREWLSGHTGAGSSADAAFVELGVDYFIVGSAGFPDMTTLELVLNQVLPALNAKVLATLRCWRSPRSSG